jgi:HlyD family secretion protein
MRKILIALLLVAILAGGVYIFMQWRANQQASALENLQTEAAGRGQLISTIGATGQVRSKQSTNLTWKTTGTVGDLFVKVGDAVQAGEKLAELKQTSLPQAIILAQADLVNAQKSLEDLNTSAETARIQALQSISNAAQAVRDAQYRLDNYIMPAELQKLSTMEALDVMQKRLDEARLAFEPVKFYPSTDPRREDLKEKLDQAQADYDAAVKRLDYEYALQVAQSNLQKARQDYEQWKNGPDPDDVAAVEARIAAAQAALSQAWIEAPFDGVVTLVNTISGDQVAMNSPAFRLDDQSSLLVDLAVSEVDINQIQPGQDVTLTFDAIRGKEYEGVVTEVDRVGSEVQGAIEFKVTVELLNPGEEVKPGMTAAVNVVVDQLEDVLLVPNRAVRFRDGKQVVYILKDNQVVPVTIQIGASSETSSEVLDGELQIGDLIVLNPPSVFESNGPPPFVRGRSQ